MLIYTLISITLLYFLFAFTKKYLKVCAICAAVSLTWFWLLVSFFLGLHTDKLLVTVLMGGSVVGIMYKLEGKFKKKDWSNFWLVRLVVILGGFSSVYLLWQEKFLLFIFVLLLTVILVLLVPRQKKEVAVNQSTWQAAKEKLKKDLENCC